jgi:hypothetical protein
MSDLQLPQPERVSRIDALAAKMNNLAMFQEINAWQGQPFFVDIFYFYLYHKYKVNCAVGSEHVFVYLCPNNESERCNEPTIVQHNIEMIKRICLCITSGVELLIIRIIRKENKKTRQKPT